MSSAWINFFAGVDPNGKSGKLVSKGTTWPVYGTGKGIVFGLNSTVVEKDNWRAEGMTWLAKHSLTVFGN